MTAVEKLACGQPQNISKGAVLLGISAWHLYPDLLVFNDNAPANIKFGDHVMSPGGLLTIGLQDRDRGAEDGVYWSLALSHLRYYGDPVVVDTSLGQGTSRLTIDELHLVALGSVLAGWGPYGKDIVAAAGFFTALWECLHTGMESMDESVDKIMCRHLISSLSWVTLLYNAAKTILGPEGVNREVALSLVALGRRRGQKLLADPRSHPPAFFGLLDPFSLKLLSQSHISSYNEKVVMMRSMAELMRLDPDSCIIRIPRQGVSGCYEYATALVHKHCSKSAQSLHQRWIETTFEDAFRGCGCHMGQRECSRAWGCECILRGTICTPSCHKRSSVSRCGSKCLNKCVGNDPNVENPCTNLVEGEVYHYIARGSFFPIRDKEASNELKWPRSVAHKIRIKLDGKKISNYLIGHTWNQSKQKTKTYPHSEIETLCHCYLRTLGRHGPNKIFTPSDRNVEYSFTEKGWAPINIKNTGTGRNSDGAMTESEHNKPQDQNHEPFGKFGNAVFNALAGDVNEVALFHLHKPRQIWPENVDVNISRASMSSSTSVATVIAALKQTVRPETLVRYIANLTVLQRLEFPRFRPDLHVHVKRLDKYMRSLVALSLVTHVYEKQLPGATVAIDILSQPLHEAAWIPESGVLNKAFLKYKHASLGRECMLSCIAMFESGSYNIRPEDLKDVMGIANRNTIYTSKTLLLDPYELSHKDEVAMIIGNVGRTGMTLMVSPPVPRIRQSELNSWRHVTHAEFDGKSADFFQPTSLHLSFTEFELPMDKWSRGTIDKDLSVVETLVSVHDKGAWLADIDVLPLFETENPLLRRAFPCGDCHHSYTQLPSTLTSLDNWEEILDMPEDIGSSTVGIVRAQNNWLARLAAACISLQRGQRTVLLPSQKTCWHCIMRRQWHWPTPRNTFSRQVDNDSDSSMHSDSLSERSKPDDGMIPSLGDVELQDASLDSRVSEWVEGVDEDETSSNDGSDDSHTSVITSIDTKNPWKARVDSDESSEDNDEKPKVNTLPEIIIL